MIEFLYWIHDNIFKFGDGTVIENIEQSGVGLITNACLFLIPFITMIIYYIIIDHPKFSNKYIWISAILSVSLITAFVLDGVIYDYVNDYANIEGIDVKEHSMYLTNIWFVNFFVSIILTVIFSFLVKLKSKNNSQTPF